MRGCDTKGGANENGKRTTLHVHHAFLYISIPSPHDHNVKVPKFTFVEDGNTRQQLSFSFPELWHSPLEFNSRTNLPTFDELNVAVVVRLRLPNRGLCGEREMHENLDPEHSGRTVSFFVCEILPCFVLAGQVKSNSVNPIAFLFLFTLRHW